MRRLEFFRNFNKCGGGKVHQINEKGDQKNYQLLNYASKPKIKQTNLYLLNCRQAEAFEMNSCT